MRDVTKAILRQINDLAVEAGARMVVAFSSGDDDDPVVMDLKSQDILVADIRPREGLYEADNLLPYDIHPGPIAQYNFFRKLSDFLESHGLVEAPMTSRESGIQ